MEDALGDFAARTEGAQVLDASDMPSADEMRLRVALVIGCAVLELKEKNIPVSEMTITKNLDDDMEEDAWMCGIEHELAIAILENKLQ